MLAYIIGVIVVLVILLLIVRRQENVVFTPDARLILGLPPIGVIEGQYWDGTLLQPCEKCTDMRECPKCPQFALYTAPQQSIESFEVPNLRPRIPSPPDHIAEILDPDRSVVAMDEYDAASAELAEPLIYDISPQYMSSRERLGACTPLSRSSCARGPPLLDVALLGTRNDDIFDGDRAVTMMGCKNVTTPVTRLLYKDVMGLRGTSKPAIDCEIISHNGYSYKQRCDQGW